LTQTKVCKKCGREKPLDEFYKDKNGILGVFLYCKTCDNLRHKIYLEKHPNHAIEKHLRQRFNLSIEKREALLKSQDGKCRICQTTDPGSRGWQIDHDHSCCSGRKICGKCIRGLLCISCNKGLGDFKDDIKLLQKAIKYLIKSKEVLKHV
jgi:hypothetical protein